MLPILAILIVGQKEPLYFPPSRNLEPTVRPYVEIPLFKAMKCITVNEYKSTDKPTKITTISRVYRFTYKARYSEEDKRWRSIFPKKDGWSIDATEPKFVVFEKPVKHPKIRWQALILHSGRIVFDPAARAQTKVIRDPEWVWISFNEVLTRKNW